MSFIEATQLNLLFAATFSVLLWSSLLAGLWLTFATLTCREED